MKSFHSYTVKSTGKKLQGVYTKDSQTTQWCQEKKKQELEEETKWLNILSISAFFQPAQKRPQRLSTSIEEIEVNVVDIFIELVIMLNNLTLDTNMLETILNDSESDSDINQLTDTESTDIDTEANDVVDESADVAKAWDWIADEDDERTGIDIMKLIAWGWNPCAAPMLWSSSYILLPSQTMSNCKRNIENTHIVPDLPWQPVVR